MYPCSSRFLEAVRNPPGIISRIEVWRSGSRVDLAEDGLPFIGGQVQVDSGKQVRRMLTGVQVEASDDMWRLLSPPGTELRVSRGFRFLNREVEMVPLGRFTIDELSENYGGDWDGQIGTAPDRMALVQRARFPVPRSFPAGIKIIDVLTILLSEVLGPVNMLSTSQDVLQSPMTAERDRAKCVEQLALSIAADVFVAPDGTPTVRDAPQIGAPVWTVNGGSETPILYSGARSRSLAHTYSAVSASAGGVSGEEPFPPQVVYDNDPLSPTYYLGPFGEVTYFMASEFFTSADQALFAAQARLPLVTAIRAQLDVTAECNPALADGDTISVILPRQGRGKGSVTERHMVAALTVPLSFDGTQSISTRSSVADVEDSQ